MLVLGILSSKVFYKILKKIITMSIVHKGVLSMELKKLQMCHTVIQ